MIKNNIKLDRNILLDSQSLKLKKETSSKVSSFTLNHLAKNRYPLLEAPLPLGHYPLNEEEVKEESLLEALSLEELPTEGIHQTFQLAANFIGGGMFTGGKDQWEFDGLNYLLNFKVWDWLFKDILKNTSTKNKTLDEIYQGIQIFKEYAGDLELLGKGQNNERLLEETSLKYAKKIKGLKAGESLPLIGGWENVGEGGHAIIYEFTRRDDDLLDITIINSTGFQLGDGSLSGNKRRINPVVLYQGIHEDLIFFNEDRKDEISTAFIQALMEVNVLSTWDINRNVDEEDILEVFDLLSDYRVSCKTYGLVTGQRGGTCVPSSTKQWIRKKTGDLGFYKQLMIHCKLRMMVATYHRSKEYIEEDSQYGELTRRALYQIATNLSNTAGKLIGEVHQIGPLIESTLARKIVATCCDLRRKIDIANIEIEKRRQNKTLPSDLEVIDVDTQRNQRKDSMRMLRTHDLSGKNEITCQRLPKNIKFENFKDFIENMETITKREDKIALLEVQQFIDQLPLPKIPEKINTSAPWVNQLEDVFWSASSCEELDICLKGIARLRVIYKLDLQANYKNVGDNPNLPKIHTSFITLYTLTHYLSLKKDLYLEQIFGENYPKARFSTYRAPNLAELTTLPIYEGQTFLGSSDYKKTKQSMDYFNAFNMQATHQPLFEGSGKAEVLLWKIGEDEPNGNFWRELTARDPNLYQEALSLGKKKWYTDPKEIERDFENQKKTLKNVTMKTNLADDTMVAMVLESTEDRFDSNFLIKKDFNKENQNYSYKHLWIYGECLYKTRELLNFNDPLRNYDDYFYILAERGKSPYKGTLIRPTLSKKNKEKITYQETFLSAFCNLEKKHVELLTEYNPCKRDQRDWHPETSEAKILDEEEISKIDISPFLQKILRTLPEWKLAPHQILYELEHHLDELKDPSIQNLLLKLIFRSPFTKKSSTEVEELYLGTGELILNDSCLLESFETSIRKGLSYFLDTKDDQNIKENEEVKIDGKCQRTGIQGGKFFFSLAFHLSVHLKDANRNEDLERLSGEVLHTIGQRLIKGAHPKDKIILHFYRALLCSVMPKGKMQGNRWLQLYESWIAYRFYDKEKFETPIELEWLENYILISCRDLALEEHKDLKDEICFQILETFHLDSYGGKLTWRQDSSNPNSAVYIATTEGKEDVWWIDFADGAIYSKVGRIGYKTSTEQWLQQQNFQRLFGNGAKFEYLFLGSGSYSFFHPSWGAIRLIENKEGNSTTYFIQRKFDDDDQWYELQDHFDKTKNIFDSDHLFWMPTKKPIAKDNEIKGYITNLKEGRRCYAVLKNGKIIEVDSSSGLPTKTSRTIDFSDRIKYETLWGFDKRNNILNYTHQETGKIEKIFFPRFISTEGNPLQFFASEKGFAWSENQEYILPKKGPQGYVGTLRNTTIYLASTKEEGKGKLLVPFDWIMQLDLGPVSKAFFSRLGVKTEGDKGEAWGQYHYFAFDIQGGVIKPTTLEAQLFLAYIHLSQKKHTEAFALLNKIKPIEAVSPMGMTILEMIGSLPLGEDHPDAKMVKLKALSVKIMQFKEFNLEFYERKTTAISFFEKDEFSELRIMVESYLQSANNVSEFCRLSEQEEYLFFQTLVEEISLRKLMERNDPRMKPFFRHLSILKDKKNIRYVKDEDFSGKRVFSEPECGRWHDVKNWCHSFSGVKEALIRKEIRVNRTQTTSQYLREETQTEYEERLNLFIRTGTYRFLTEGKKPICSLYTRSLNDRKNPGKDRTLFEKVIELARSGKESEKREMLFRLRLWHFHAEERDEILEILIGILCSNNKPKKSFDEVKKDGLNILQYLVEIAPNDRIDDSVVEKKIKNVIKKQSSSKVGETHFPVLRTNVFNTHQKTKEEIIHDYKPVHVDLKIEGQRYEQLIRWKKLVDNLETYPEPKEKIQFSFKFSESFLTKEEKDFKDPLVKDLQALENDYEEGKKQNEEEKIPVVDDILAGNIHGQAIHLKNDLDEQIKNKTRELLEKYANRGSSDPKEHLFEMAKTIGNVKKNGSFLDCIDALLSLDPKDYILMNPHLTENEINEIAQRTLEIVDLKSYQAQLIRLSDLCRDIKNIRSPEDPTRKYLCYKLDHELKAGYVIKENGLEFCPLIDQFKFSDDVKISLRVFSGLTGMLPHDKQFDIIEKMLQMTTEDSGRFKDIVIQLIMGGGKTKVIGAIILYLAAKRKDRLGMFIVPDSLFEVVKANLSEDIFKAFNKHVLAIDAERKDLNSEERVDHILNKIEDAKRRGYPIIIKGTTLQSFQLELLSRVRELQKKFNAYKKIESKGDLQVLEEAKKQFHEIKDNISLEPLTQICREFSRKGDSLLDEVDILLDCLKELNFPEGDTKAIASLENNLLHEIYKNALTSHTLKVKLSDGERSIADIVRLEENNQSLMDTDLYKQKVVPVIAQHLIDNHLPFQEPLEDFKSSFVKYVSGTMSVKIQHFADSKKLEINEENLNKIFPEWKKYDNFSAIKKEITFLRRLKKWHGGKDKKLRSLSNLISLTRHVLLVLTPATLSKSGRRDYGPDLEANSHKIIPYVAVNSPATTKFGYHLEEACYYYQWAIAFPIEERDVLEIGGEAQEMTDYYIKEHGEKFEETVEYQFFHDLFGITLKDLDKKEKIKEAVKNISEAKSTSKRLDLAYEIVQKNVALYEERLTSNNMNFLDQLSSHRSMSGTPWNVEGFMSSLAENYKSDLGTEGKILHKLAEKEQEVRIHEADLQSVEKFLNTIIDKHPSPQNIRGIIETGGLFKKFKDNETVALEILKCLVARQEKEDKLREKNQLQDKDRTVDPNIDGVLFFRGDVLYAWKKGATQAEKIGSSSPDNISAKGLDPKRYFVFYDEKHTTGTDILQIPEAINIITFDEKMLLRSFDQGIMRLRQFLYSQNIILAVSKETRELLINKGEKLEDFILSAQKAQTLRKTTDMVRFFRQQIDNLFRRRAVEAILNAIENRSKNLIEIVTMYEPYFLTTMKEDFYTLFGRLEESVDTKKMLIDSLEQKYKVYCERIHDGSEKILEIDKDKLKEYINEVTCLPKEWKDSASPIGVQNQVKVQCQTETSQKVQVETAVEIHIDLELKNYEMLAKKNCRKENGISETELLEMIKDLQQDKPSSSQTIPLKTQLSKYDYSYLGEKKPYQDIFDSPIYGTQAYFYPTESNLPLPIFSKTHRPPKQILAVDTEQGMRWLLLSEKEAGDVQQHLQKLYDTGDKQVKKVWLIQPNGDPLHKGKNVKPLRKVGDILKGLLEINVLAGNIHYLDKNNLDFEEWLCTKSDLKAQFLKLKMARNKLENHILINRLSMMGIEEEDSSNFRLFKKRIEKKFSETEQHLYEKGVVKYLDVKEIEKLPPSLIPFLGIDWNEKDICEDTKTAIRKLNNKRTFIKNKIEADKYSRDCFSHLRGYHISHLTQKQIQWLPDFKVKFIKNPEQAKGLQEEQVASLIEEQDHLIPYLSTACYKKLKDLWQIAAVPVERLNEIDSNYLPLITKNQVKECDLSLLIDGSTFLLEKIPKKLLEHISRGQIQKISDQTLIQKLEAIASQNPIEVAEGLWTSWLSANQVDKINFDTQIKYITSPDVIQKIPLQHTEKLLPSQTNNINKQQAEKLSIPQMNALREDFPPEKISYFQDKDLEHLPNYLIKHLSSDQVRGLKNDFPLDKLPEIVFDKLNSVPKDFIKHFSEKQIENLPNNFSTDKIPEIVFDKLNSIPKGFTKHFSKEQIENLPNDFSKDKIPEIAFDKLNSIPKDFIKHFSKDQIENLPNDFSTDKIPEIAFDKLKFVPKGFIKHFSKEQIEKLASDYPQEKIRFIADVNLRHLNEKSLITSIGYRRVQHLTWLQLRKRHWFWNTVYVIGVVTLGLVSTALACVAYMTLVPFVAAFLMRRPGQPNRVYRFMHANTVRMIRFGRVVWCGTPYAA